MTLNERHNCTGLTMWAVTWVVIVRCLPDRFGIRPDGPRVRDWLVWWVIDIVITVLGLLIALELLILLGAI